MKKMLKWGGIALFSVLAIAIISLYAAVTYRWKGDFFNANGVAIHYIDEGNPQGEPVVLVHGFAANTDINWRYTGVIRGLKKQGHRVIALDMRGHGLSGKPAEESAYGMEMVDDIARLLDHLDIPRAHVVGYSMGGLITLKFVATHPGRLLSATVGGAGWFDLQSPKIQILQNLGTSLDEGGGFAPLVNGLHPDSMFPGIEGRVASFAIDFVNDRAALRALLPGMLDWLVTEDVLRANQVPLLVICGTNDPMKEGAHNLEGVAAHTTVVYVEGGDHESTVFKELYHHSLAEHIASCATSTPAPESAAQDNTGEVAAR
jgi:pimeloyl-ACP methyl ester carboxylesterase